MTERLGQYELKRELGRGGMGVVYLARDTELDRHVALKVLRPELTQDAASLKRFRQEAMAVARLRHPNIVQIYGIGEDEQQTWFVMEYVDGMGLDQILRVDGALEPEQAIDIAVQVAGALEEAHGKDVIHRDIKPANILVDSLGRVTVTDFGLARVMGASALTDPDMVIGTPEYMPPERASASGLTPAGDIYSLGMVLYEVLTGERPKPDATGGIPAPETVDPRIPRQLSRIIMRALARDPEDRYQSAAGLAHDLRDYLDRLREETRPLQVDSARQAPAVLRLLRRHSRILRGAALLLLVWFSLDFLYFRDLRPGQQRETEVYGNFMHQSTSHYQPLQVSSPTFPRLQELTARPAVRYGLLIALTLAISFWFWMLVDCLEHGPRRRLFGNSQAVNRLVWLVLFVVLNLVGALLYALLSQKRAPD